MAASLSLLGGCALSTGYVRLGRPHVYDSKTTREALTASGERITERIRRDADLKTVQEAASFAETTALSLRAAGQGAAAGAQPGTPSVPGAAAVENAKVGGLVADAAKGLGRTIDEQVNDFAHAENLALDVQLLYSGKGDDALAGKDARIYLVRFDLGLLPSRQKWYAYPWFGLQTAFGSVYRFTQGWSIAVNFELEEGKCRASGPVYVYDVDPRYGVATSLDSLANVNQLQLAATYAAPGAAAALDYLNRVEEQFAQQRRYPLQVGFVDGACRFGWIFGPRRTVQRRGWVRVLPFVSDYVVQSRLEPGPRTGHVILVVPDYDEFASGASSTAEFAVEHGDADPRSSLEDRADDHLWSRDEKVEPESKGTPAGKLSLDASARFIELDRPDTYVPVPVSTPEGRGTAKVARIVLKLPDAPPPRAQSQAATLTLLAPPAAGDRIAARVTVEGETLEQHPGLEVSLRNETTKEPLEVLEVSKPSGASVDVEARRPRKPASGNQVELSAAIEAGGKAWKTSRNATYTGPPWGPDGLVLSCPAGGVGSIVEARLSGFDADAIHYVQFGSAVLLPGAATPGWSAKDEGRTVRFAVPRQIKKNADLDVPKDGTVVDVSAFLKDKTVYRAAGGFTYRSTKPCLP